MTNKKKWIIGAAVVGGIALIALVLRKKTLGYTGPSYIPTTPPVTNPPTTIPGTTPQQSGPIGKNAYVGQPGLIVRSSPELNDGWFGLWGGNNVGSVSGVGTWLGVVQSTIPDSDGKKNPSTGNPFVWYQVKINPALLLLAADRYYVREDYTNLK